MIAAAKRIAYLNIYQPIRLLLLYENFAFPRELSCHLLSRDARFASQRSKRTFQGTAGCAARVKGRALRKGTAGLDHRRIRVTMFGVVGFQYRDIAPTHAVV